MVVFLRSVGIYIPCPASLVALGAMDRNAHAYMEMRPATITELYISCITSAIECLGASLTSHCVAQGVLFALHVD